MIGEGQGMSAAAMNDEMFYFIPHPSALIP
jgi:hypothetical protein